MREITNFEALKQMPVSNFANVIFEVVRRDCRESSDFEAFLKKEVPKELESTLEEALQDLQHLNKY